MVLINSSSTNYETLWIFEFIVFMSAQFMYSQPGSQREIFPGGTKVDTWPPHLTGPR